MRKHAVRVGLFATLCLGLLLGAGCGGGGPPSPVSGTASFDAVSPSTGPVEGGTPLTLTGAGFREGRVGPVVPNEVTVLIAGRNAVDVVLMSDTEIHCRTPDVCDDATVDIVVLTTGSTLTREDAFTYTGGPNAGCEPGVSPDRILFVEGEGTAAELWSMTNGGGDRRRLTDNEDLEYSVRWAPSRTQVGHLGTGFSGFNEIVVRNADGSNPMDATVLGSQGVVISSFSYAPLGGELVFAAFGQGVFRLDPASGQQAMLSANPAARDPSWAPDLSRLVFAAASLFTVDAQGATDSELLPAVPGEIYFSQPDWGPDAIVFVRSVLTETGSVDTIWRIDPDGSNLTQLTSAGPGHGNDDQPRWSPDGSQIAFLRQTDPNEADSVLVFVMNADGSSEALVPGQQGRVHSLDW